MKHSCRIRGTPCLTTGQYSVGGHHEPTIRFQGAALEQVSMLEKRALVVLGLPRTLQNDRFSMTERADILVHFLVAVANGA